MNSDDEQMRSGVSERRGSSASARDMDVVRVVAALEELASETRSLDARVQLMRRLAVARRAGSDSACGQCARACSLPYCVLMRLLHCLKCCTGRSYAKVAKTPEPYTVI